MASDLRTLPAGTIVSDYRLERVLGQGGFGITYLAMDLKLNQQVAVKEFYPREFAARDRAGRVRATGGAEDQANFIWGLERFREEARTLGRFRHPNIIAVRRLFEANGTAYIVMDFCEGEPLDAVIKRKAPLDAEALERIFIALLDGLAHVHAAGIMHRDIKPANIFIRSDGSPVLLDFGAARQALVGHSRSMTSLATAHFAAFEQYSTHGRQGPWTDIYGLAATLYNAATGEKPQDSPDRMMQDRIVALTSRAAGRYPVKVLQAIDAGLAILPENRPQSVLQWRDFLTSNAERLVPFRHISDPRPTLQRPMPVSAKKPILITIGVFGGVLTLAALGFALHGLPSPDPSQSSRVRAPLQAPIADASEATSANDPEVDTAEPENVDDVQRLMQNYIDASSQNDVDYLASIYAENVNFYGKRTPKHVIIRQKEQYMVRWPVRSWTVKPGSWQQSCLPDGECRVSIVAEWRSANPAQNRMAQGASTVEIGFKDGLVVFEQYR